MRVFKGVEKTRNELNKITSASLKTISELDGRVFDRHSNIEIETAVSLILMSRIGCEFNWSTQLYT